MDYIVIYMIRDIQEKLSTDRSNPKASLYNGLVNLSPDPRATCLALIIFSI
jgi:hypothetical protein